MPFFHEKPFAACFVIAFVIVILSFLLCLNITYRYNGNTKLKIQYMVKDFFLLYVYKLWPLCIRNNNCVLLLTWCECLSELLWSPVFRPSVNRLWTFDFFWRTTLSKKTNLCTKYPYGKGIINIKEGILFKKVNKSQKVEIYDVF